MADGLLILFTKITNYNIKELLLHCLVANPFKFDIGKYIPRTKKYCYHTSKILSCGIITNGTLLSNEIINELKIYNVTISTL